MMKVYITSCLYSLCHKEKWRTSHYETGLNLENVIHQNIYFSSITILTVGPVGLARYLYVNFEAYQVNVITPNPKIKTFSNKWEKRRGSVDIKPKQVPLTHVDINVWSRVKFSGYWLTWTCEYFKCFRFTSPRFCWKGKGQVWLCAPDCDYSNSFKLFMNYLQHNEVTECSIRIN